jgi:hypothetical protein
MADDQPMRIAQIVLPGASAYERKSQRIDQAVLSQSHELVPVEEAQVVHIYGPSELPTRELARLTLPYVANAPVPKSRWPWRRVPQPRALISPLADPPVPEAVEEGYFAAGNGSSGFLGVPRSSSESADFAEELRGTRGTPRNGKTIASYRRPGIDDFLQRTLARIERFRSDVQWHLYESQPSPADLASVDLWVDPALSEHDFDGFVAEALVVGTPVVAARNAINTLRLERGRTGFLVPSNDPNEMTHAILTALFKPEVAQSRLQAARQTASKYRPRQRARVLVRLYESLIS